jgi:hypothetical protein
MSMATGQPGDDAVTLPPTMEITRRVRLPLSHISMGAIAARRERIARASLAQLCNLRKLARPTRRVKWVSPISPPSAQAPQKNPLPSFS